jgi:hypothetical protein
MATFSPEFKDILLQKAFGFGAGAASTATKPYIGLKLHSDDPGGNHNVFALPEGSYAYSVGALHLRKDNFQSVEEIADSGDVFTGIIKVSYPLMIRYRSISGQSNVTATHYSLNLDPSLHAGVTILSDALPEPIEFNYSVPAKFQRLTIYIEHNTVTPHSGLSKMLMKHVMDHTFKSTGACVARNAYVAFGSELVGEVFTEIPEIARDALNPAAGLVVGTGEIIQDVSAVNSDTVNDHEINCVAVYDAATGGNLLAMGSITPVTVAASATETIAFNLKVL